MKTSERKRYIQQYDTLVWHLKTLSLQEAINMQWFYSLVRKKNIEYIYLSMLISRICF